LYTVILDAPWHPYHEASAPGKSHAADEIIGSVAHVANQFETMYFNQGPSFYGNHYGGANTSYGGPNVPHSYENLSYSG